MYKRQDSLTVLKIFYHKPDIRVGMGIVDVQADLIFAA